MVVTYCLESRTVRIIFVGYLMLDVDHFFDLTLRMLEIHDLPIKICNNLLYSPSSDRSLPSPSPTHFLRPFASLPSPHSLPPLSQVDYRQGGSEYHFSWRHDNGRKYPWEHAVRYCSSLGHGWSGISIETHEEDRSVSNIITGGVSRALGSSGPRLSGRSVEEDSEGDFLM